MSTRETRRFGKIVRAIRQAKGLTQEAVEHEIGAHTGYLSRVEAGEKNVSLTTIMRLAKALSVSITFGSEELK